MYKPVSCLVFGIAYKSAHFLIAYKSAHFLIKQIFFPSSLIAVPSRATSSASTLVISSFEGCIENLSAI